jgi:hypothetical protein
MATVATIAGIIDGTIEMMQRSVLKSSRILSKGLRRRNIIVIGAC